MSDGRSMERLRPQSRRKRPVSKQVQNIVGYVWIIASLALPAAGVAVISGAPLSSPNEVATSHTVSAGETLSIIARRYGVSVDELVQVNGLNNQNLIYVGQVLSIPRQNRPEGQVYTVQRGDTLAAIANRYSTDIANLIAANNLVNPDILEVGQQLVIPSLQAAQPVEQPVTEVVNQPRRESINTYTLQRGDSLYRVSLIFGTTVDTLIAANNLASPNSIYPGLVLRIPTREGQVVAESAPQESEENTIAKTQRTYTVRAGDTLARIAVAHDVTVDGLVAANGIVAADRIYPGQMLNIPAPGASARPAPARAATTHVIQYGETMLSIAMRYGVTLHSLSAANNISDPSRIFAGMVLSIPSAQVGTNSVRYASVGSGLCSEVTPTQSGTGYFIRPVRGYRISQDFHAWHPGIDLALTTGSPVYAADGGTVVYAGWNTIGYGNLVVLDHGNGWRTYYAHLSSISVSCGEFVGRGAAIGAVGSTGNSTGPHLHFEMLRFGVAINPVGYIRF